MIAQVRNAEKGEGLRSAKPNTKRVSHFQVNRGNNEKWAFRATSREKKKEEEGEERRGKREIVHAVARAQKTLTESKR